MRPFPGCISESSLSRTSGGAGTHVTRFSMQVGDDQLCQQLQGVDASECPLTQSQQSACLWLTVRFSSFVPDLRPATPSWALSEGIRTV